MAKDAKVIKEEIEAEIITSDDVVEEKTNKSSSHTAKADWAIEHSGAHHYSDMAKMSAGLLIGVLALMVFLLSVGLQHPKPLLRSFLYVALASLGLSLLFYQLGVLVEGSFLAKGHAAHKALDHKDSSEKVAKSRRTLGATRVVQQLIFAIAIIATVGFAIEASQLFFVTAAAPAQSQGQSQQSAQPAAQ
jgi:hypothetical protein